MEREETLFKDVLSVFPIGIFKFQIASGMFVSLSFLLPFIGM